MKDQALRSVLQRFRKSAKDTRWYSVKPISTNVVQYGSYVMLKPESEETDMSGISEEEVESMLAYSEKCKEKKIPQSESKSKSVMALLQQKHQYCPQLTTEDNFNVMYDWLVDNCLYNMYTEIKMSQLFGMWKAMSESKEDRESYRRVRARFAKFVCIEKYS